MDTRMKNYFDRNIASTYDQGHGGGDPSEITATAEVLAALATGGRALEFAIGTGRIAIPLNARGVDVSGIELSEDMVAEMRRKDGGADIPVAIGDMATTRVQGSFALVFLVFNTICNLTNQAAQAQCFANAAAHLAPGGRFVVETLLPPLQKLPFGETRLAFDRSDGHWGIDEFDVVSQEFTSHHVWFEGGATRTLSLPLRYVWPSELDLMARLAGMTLEHRWADWDRSPFTATSEKHVSVWRKEDS
ncbi:MAG: class I SAM-dependent methyltransferase [Pseudomonadota bacterium]